MQPSARLAATIELLASIEAAIVSRGLPADRLTAEYFRARRFAGSKDKRAISDMVYTILREREWLIWGLETVSLQVDARVLVLAHLARHDVETLGLLGADDKFAPAALTEEEALATGKLGALDWSAAPIEAQANVPAWAVAGLKARFADDFATAMTAFLHSAPLDVRINALKSTDSNLSHIINISSENIEKIEYSKSGYRVSARINLGAEKAYRDGLVEIQDAAAQVASALVAAQPGQQVVDLCAGGGGKSLAVAADMANKGQIHAFDISGKRLADFRARIQRAGARNIQVTRIAPEGEGRKTALSGLEGKADRVLVDVPCTGTGTWRRSPDQRWRFDGESLASLNELQASLLAEAASMVKLGGRLIYMSCSLLPAENEHIIQSFTADSGGQWALLDYKSVWRDVLAGDAPETLSLEPKCLQLAPHVHDTDGFFVAILERKTVQK